MFNPLAYLNHLFVLIFPCKTVWQLPQDVRRSPKGWSSGAESFPRVPQESSWLVVPHDMNHLTPRCPSGVTHPDVCAPLISEQPPARSSCHCRAHPLAFFLPLFGSKFHNCCSSLVHFNQIWPCFEQKPDPISSRYPSFALLFLYIHKNPRRFGCKLPNPWWDGVPSTLPTWGTAPPAPSWDRSTHLLCLCLLSPAVPSLVGSKIHTGNLGDQQDTPSLAREEPEVHSCSSSLGDRQRNHTPFLFIFFFNAISSLNDKKMNLKLGCELQGYSQCTVRTLVPPPQAFLPGCWRF